MEMILFLSLLLHQPPPQPWLEPGPVLAAEAQKSQTLDGGGLPCVGARGLLRAGVGSKQPVCHLDRASTGTKLPLPPAATP